MFGPFQDEVMEEYEPEEGVQSRPVYIPITS